MTWIFFFCWIFYILYEVFDIIFIYGNLLFLLQNLFHFCILQVYFVSIYEVWGDIVLLLEICVLISFQEYLVCSSELNWFWPSLIFFKFLPSEVIFHENITKIICACVFQATLFIIIILQNKNDIEIFWSSFFFILFFLFFILSVVSIEMVYNIFHLSSFSYYISLVVKEFFLLFFLSENILLFE